MGYYNGYCELPEFYSESFPKARKTHWCVECAAPINLGEEHLYYRGKWDGEFGTGRQHMLCRELCMFVRDEFQSGECLAFGELFENECEYHWGSRYDRTVKKAWGKPEQKARALMAGVKHRMRKYRSFRKRDGGVLMNRKWGTQWKIVEEKPLVVPGT